MRETWVDPWVGKIPWRRAWQVTPVFLPGEPPCTEEPGGLQASRSQSRTRLSMRAGLSCAMQHLVPWLGIGPQPLLWELGVLAPGPAGKSQGASLSTVECSLCSLICPRQPGFHATVLGQLRSLFLKIKPIQSLSFPLSCKSCGKKDSDSSVVEIPPSWTV